MKDYSTGRVRRWAGKVGAQAVRFLKMLVGFSLWVSFVRTGFGLGFISSVKALRGLEEAEDGFPAGGAGACCVISSLVMASSGSDSVEDILGS